MNGDRSFIRNKRFAPPTRILVIGDAASRRVAEFSMSARRIGLNAPTILSYRKARERSVLEDAVSERTLVRLESPGACPETTRVILTAGIPRMEELGRVPIGESEIESMRMDRGEILHPLQWYLGFQAILEELQASGDLIGVDWMSTPAAIATTFDKLACRELWSAEGLPMPSAYPEISTYEQLRRTIVAAHRRLFVKLRYGYSAIGAIALEWRDSKVRAVTTVEVEWTDGRPRLFVSKRPQMLQRESEIAWLIDTLGKERVVVEDWLPKARWQGTPYDLRVITVGGEPRHVVGRASSSPFTNLNLDARRVPAEVVAQQLGGAWQDCLALSRRASSVLPGAGALGIDLIIRPCRRSFALLEANGFGDYLPGLLDRGETTYESELRFALSSREAQVS